MKWVQVDATENALVPTAIKPEPEAIVDGAAPGLAGVSSTVVVRILGNNVSDQNFLGIQRVGQIGMQILELCCKMVGNRETLL